MPKKTKKFTGTTHIGFVLDRSGSMASIASDAVGGFNTWLKGVQDEGGDVTLTLVRFDHEFELPYVRTPIADVAPLDEKTYVPRGSTALFDAIGRCIGQLDPDVGPKDRALVVILTDGYENASLEIVTKDDLKKLITDHEAKGNWTFAYIAANQDAFQEGFAIGIARGSTQNFQATAHGTQQAYAVTTKSTKHYLQSSEVQSRSFYQPEDKE